MGFFSFLFGGSNKALQQAIAEDAYLLDVRTAGEFDRGHAAKAVNIPLDRLPMQVSRIAAMKVPVVVMCESGNRSSQAKKMLEKGGVQKVINAGSWRSLTKFV